MAAMTSFPAEKCHHLVSEHEASAGAYAAAFRQLMIYSTFVYYNLKKFMRIYSNEALLSSWVCGPWSTCFLAVIVCTAVKQPWLQYVYKRHVKRNLILEQTHGLYVCLLTNINQFLFTNKSPQKWL